ncbi:MAG: hypothetical protein K9L89_02600 [Kiritimatiellales bacterium]|nr:hypothetical protein [Kiritimatiellales bacterium]
MNTYPEWLDDAVMYNIFPASFYDSNGDGIGDLPGIVEKLDYIQSLGVNLVWINPIYDSPFQDGGYDVRDYYHVAERYGSNADVVRLCREAKKRGMRIMLDLVPGHTSIEHAWFKASASGKKTTYDNRYVWTDHIFRGAPGLFLGGDTERSGKYLINFFSFQPALNYGYLNPKEPWQIPINHPDAIATRDELKKTMEFWLKKGVSGFRVDMANSLVKDDVDGKGLKIIYSDIRSWLDKNWPEAVLLAEWSEPNNAIRCGFHMDFLLHSAPAYTQLFRMEPGSNVVPDGKDGISFFRKAGGGQCIPFLDYLQAQLRSIGRRGLISMPTGNHDLPRISIGRTASELKVAYGFVFTLPVVPALYYGDETGMRHLADAPNRDGAYVRAGCRTPMQWNRARNAGFSAAPASRLYLPLDKSKARPLVSEQENDPDSLLNFVRQLIALRKTFPALGTRGKLVVLHADPDGSAVVYMRSWKGRKLVVALNPADRNETVSLRLKGNLALRISCGDVAAEQQSGSASFLLNGVGFAVFELR